MSTIHLPSLHWPFGLSQKDIKAAFLCWAVYASLPVLYCLTSQLVYNSKLNIFVSLAWSLCDWGIWLVVLPFVFKYLGDFEGLKKNRITHHTLLIASVLLFVVSFRAGLDALTGDRSLAKSLFRFVPIYAAAVAVIIATWYLLFRQKQNEQGEISSQPAARTYPETLLVHKGNSECLIRVDQIQCIKAAGNYVEIYCDNQPYLARSTMKQIEQTLPPSQFLRTHRSHIINIDEIDRIHALASDNAAVELRCGMSLSIGKKYKPRLKEQRLH